MRVVIYTEEMEPITIIDLPLDLLRMGYERRYVRVPVPTPVPISLNCNKAYPKIDDIQFYVVELQFDLLVTIGKFGKRVESWIITTGDKVQALRLKPSWLPGQQAEINRYNETINVLTEALVSALKGIV